jgi:ParB family chromosome partitioning protein
MSLKEQMAASFERRKEPSVSAQNSGLSKGNTLGRFALAEQISSAHESADAGQRLALVTTAANGPGGLALPDGLSEKYRAWCIANGYTPGQSIDLPLNALKDSSFNPRHFYPQKLLEPLKANIAENKQQSPIHVIPDYDQPGTFIINDGGRRVRSLRQLHMPSAKAIVVDLPVGIQSYKLGYDLNTQRNSQTAFDNAVKWRRMLDERLFESQKDLAEALGVDESTMTTTLAIAKLPEDIMMEMVLEAEHFGTRMAYEICRFYELTEKNTEDTVELIRRVVRNDLGVRQVQQIRQEVRPGNGRSRKASRSVFNKRIEYRLPGGESAGELKTYDGDRIELSLRGLPSELRDELHRKIEEVLRPLRDPAGDGAGPHAGSTLPLN